MKKFTSVVMAVMALTGTVAFVGAGASEAAPSGCHAERNGRYVTGTCDHGNGVFRLRADCQWWPDSVSAWTSAGSYASVGCGHTGSPRGWSFEVKD